MSSEDNKSKYTKNEQLKKNNENINNYILQNNNEEKSFNNNLIKPIPINPKLIKNQKSNLNTLRNSSISNINQNSNLPIMRPKNNHCSQISKDSLSEKNKSKNSEIDEKENTFNNTKEILCCNCTKTKCIKKYCECFANKKFCHNNCNCQDCINKKDYLDNNIKYSNENNIIICTCTRSNFNKKYCECYKYGQKCNEKCRCLHCKNTGNQNQNQDIILTVNNNNVIFNNDNKNNDNINNKIENKNERNHKLDEINNINSKGSIINENLNEELKIQRISVFINKNQTLINVEKFNKKEMNLLCKKRNYIQNSKHNHNQI